MKTELINSISKIKIAITADLHFRAKRLADIKKGWDELVDCIIQEQTDYLLVAGDIFEDFNIAGREASFGTIYHAFKSGLDRFISQGGQAVFVPGNHDIAGPNDLDALTPLNGLPGIIVERGPVRIRLRDKIYIQCLPWLGDLKSYEGTELIPPAHQEGVNILLGHCEVEGTAIKDGYSLFGGHFELNKTEFNNKGYDHVALGHIHKRMDYYVGAPWHLSYGDNGNPAGFMMLTIKDNKISSEEFIEILSSPRYHVYVDDIQEKKHRDIDYVRIKYHGNPPDVGELDAGDIELEKIPEQDSVRVRSDIALDSTVGEMLQAWITANNRAGLCVDELMKFVDADAIRNYQLSQATGSLQRIRNITLKHIGPHEDTKISMNGEKFIAVSGHNGSGKSFAVDSLVAVPFGDFPSKHDPTMTHITQGYDGQAEISNTFDSNGQTYLAQRVFNKGKQKAYLSLLDGDGGKSLVAGPKVTDYEREIYKLLGDKKLVLSSVFSAQGNKGDIVDASRTERKEILGNILGIGGLAEIAELAKQGSARTNTEITVAASTVAGINELKPEENIRQQTQMMQQHQDALLSLDTEIKACQEEIVAAEEDGRRCGAEKADIEAAIDSLELITAEVSTLQHRKQETLSGIKKKQEIIADEIGIMEKLREIENARSEYEKYRDVEARNLKAKEQQLSIDKDIQAQEAIIDNEKQRLLNDIKILQEGRVAANDRYKTRITNIDNDIDALQKKQQLLSRAGCKESPMPCVFIDDGLKAGKEIEEKRTEQKEVVAQMNAFNKTNIDRISDIETRVNGNEYTIEARGEIDNLQQARAQIAFQEVDGRAHTLKAVIDTESTVRTQHQQIQTTKALLNELDKKVEELDNEIVEKLERQKLLEEKAHGYDEIRGKYNRLKEDWERAGQRRNNIHKQQIDVHKLIAAIEGDIKNYKEKIGHRKSLEAEISKAEEARKNYDVIAEAFGRNGIQQLLIASALPQIQDILNTLLGELDNKFYITFATQGETKAGKTIETLDILVSDSRGERSIERFSGGEQKLLRSVIRIALAIFQSQRAGSKYEVFVIDEAFDALDRENATKMLRILLKLEDRFNQIFIVSHTDDLLAEFPARINFNTVNGVSRHDFITN